MKDYLRKVNYYECDPMGITHHSNYIRYMEEARIDMQDQLGYGYEKMEADGIVSPVVALNCEYKRSTRFQDEILVHLSLQEVTPLRLTFGYEMTCRGQLIFRASSVHCFLENGRPMSLEQRYPEFFRALVENLGR